MRRSAPLPPRFTVGDYYAPLALPRSTASPTLNRLRVVPFDNPRTQRFDRIAAEVTTLGSGATLRWVIYADTGFGKPGALLLDTGATGDASTNGVKEATINLVLAARRYWLGVIVQTADASLRIYSGADAPAFGIPSGSLASSTGALGYFTSSVTGAAPSTFPTTPAATSQAPVVWLRAAA